ncbi:MAG: hypothetical protein ABSE73_08020 [Planctomycetota bacterium]
MRHLWVAALLGAAVLLARAQEPEANVNERYSVESAEISGADQSKLDQPVRDDLRKLVGQKFSQEKLEELSKLIRKAFPGRPVSIQVSRGSTPEQVKDDDLSVFDPTQNPNYRRQQMARAGGRLKKNAGEEAKKEMVVLMQLMRVRIPLTGKDATAITLEAEAMKAKIKPEVAKFLEKKKEAKEGEEAEPDMEEMNQYGQQQGGPVFFSFYATVKENVRSDALADAIKKATESANAAAKLLNKTAELHSLGLSQDFNNQYYNQYYNEYNQYNRYGGRFNMPKSDELYSQIPAMAVQAAISATFLLK